MGDLNLKAASGGQIVLTPTNTASNFTLTLPAKTGNIITSADSATVTPTMLSQPLTAMTSQASTSGTSIDFTSIPSWAKRITLMLSGVSTNGTSYIRIQLGSSGSVETTGYVNCASYVNSLGSANASTSSANGFDSTGDGTAASVRNGWFQLVNITGNTWLLNGAYCVTGNASTFTLSIVGSKSTAATLDRVRLTTVNGTDAFDAGTVNVFYE